MYNYKRCIHITSLLRNSTTNVSASDTATTRNYTMELHDQHVTNNNISISSIHRKRKAGYG